MKRIILALGLAATLCSTAAADFAPLGSTLWRTTENPRVAQFQPPDHVQKAIDEAIKKTVDEKVKELPPGITVPPHGVIGDADQGKIGTPNIIVQQPTAPPKAIIDTGGIAGEIIQWVVATFGTVIAGYVVLLVKRAATKAGIQVSQQASDRLDEIVLNGLHAGANAAQKQLTGKAQVEVKNAALANAVTYVQQHGADTLKTLGVDPNDPKTVEVLRARAEKLVTDPTIPTPPVLDAAPPAPPPKVAAA